jgi:hypothetical protein
MISFNTNYKLKEPTMEFYHESKNKVSSLNNEEEDD